jgi:malate permease and related proteins
VLRLFADNLLPVLLVAGAGWLLAWRTKMDAKPITTLAFNVLAPCFVFDVVARSGDLGALLRMMGYVFATLLTLAALTALLGRALGWPRQTIAAAALVVLLPNAGNFGLSANLFAFGEAGVANAGLFFVASSILTFTIGVLIASSGHTHPLVAARGLVKVPAVWAVVAAMILILSGWRLPLPVERSIELLSSACVPIFIAILGIQLYGRGVRGPWQPVLGVSALRLLGGAATGIAMAPLLGLTGAARQAGVLQAAMPSAVICTILATEYDLEPEFVTSVVVVSTLLSPLTLTPLLAYLGA